MTGPIPLSDGWTARPNLEAGYVYVDWDRTGSWDTEPHLPPLTPDDAYRLGQALTQFDRPPINTGLPSNPHEEYAVNHDSPAAATLALAYEIRTMTLANFPYSKPDKIAARLGTTEEP